MQSEPAGNQAPPNHLIGEKSPYLQQHAHNPVDWYPWSAEAFRRAEAEERPVFLSIGYATCHWCHVMAHESFEDAGIAGLLNAAYIAIKVDREERPDIDSIYMAACQQMTGQGGWPLTIIMTPDKKPFFAGTYFPRTSRAGMTGLSDILGKVTRLWTDDRASLTAAGDQIAALLAEPPEAVSGGSAGPALLADGYDELAASFDTLHGGFGRAPKFPVPSRILFLLRYGKRTGSARALRMAEQTLEAMRCGGIHDHPGGGFHRYSTDTAWRVPHFEKMLYDQALLLMAFTEAWQATKNPLYRETAEEIITYVIRDLLSPEGAFISAEDADSPGGEGAYYLWTRAELDAALGKSDGAYAAALFHVKDTGNFADREGSGKNILFLAPDTVSQNPDTARFSSIRKRLFEARQERRRPDRDRKILTDWNGLMIAALAQAARAFDRPDYHERAAGAMHFILGRLKTPDGGLLHRYCDGEAAIPAFCDDYAFVIYALIGLYQAGFEPAWLEEALRLTLHCNRHFADPGGSGYYSTSDDGEVLIARRKELYDGALPSGNSVMLMNLVLLGHLTGNPDHEAQAFRLADAFAGTAGGNPSAYTTYLCGLDHLLGPATDVVIAGEIPDPEVMQMIRAVGESYLPDGTLHVRTSRSANALDTLAPFTKHMTAYGQSASAYVCYGKSCSAPVMTSVALQELLGRNAEKKIALQKS